MCLSVLGTNLTLKVSEQPSGFLSFFKLKLLCLLHTPCFILWVIVCDSGLRALGLLDFWGLNCFWWWQFIHLLWWKALFSHFYITSQSRCSYTSDLIWHREDFRFSVVSVVRNNLLLMLLCFTPQLLLIKWGVSVARTLLLWAFSLFHSTSSLLVKYDTHFWKSEHLAVLYE